MTNNSTTALQFVKSAAWMQSLKRSLIALISIMLSTVVLVKGQSSGSVQVPIITVNASVPSNGASVGTCFYQNNFAFGINNLDANATYVWDFGDGSTSTATNPTHSYTSAGNFKVHLVATIGNQSAASDQFINVYPTPTPSFNVYADAANGNAYSFQSSSNVASGYITSYVWDFGDGTGNITSNPTKIYGATGSYSVKLVVITDNGCKDSITQSVAVTKTGSVVNASFNVNATTQCINNNSFAFNNTSITGSGVTYLWDFGDGNTSNTYNASHVYSTANTYNVTLTVTRGTDVSVAVSTITVAPQPSASFTTAVTDNVVVFTPSASVANGSIASYQWDFGDNTFSTLQSPSHTYTSANTYNVKLFVTSTSGCSSAISSQNVSVTMPVVTPPSATPDVPSFTASSAQCLQGNSYTFTNTSVINGTGATYSWNFGDNSSLVATTNATHSFSNSGTYKVTLTVISSAGTSVSTQAVTVYAQPNASFSINNTGATYTFNSTSSVASGSISSSVWQSSNGGSATGSQYTQTFSPGSYTVTLAVTSDNGCTSEIAQSITYLTPVSNASFSVSGTALSSCYVASNSFTFTNTSTIGSDISYVWDFGDGTTATTYNVNHQYTRAGTYIVRLTVSNGSQVLYATPVTIALNPVPTPEFLLYLNTTLTSLSSEVKRCFIPGMDFSFMSSSTVQSGQMHYKWSFATNAIYFRDGDSLDYINPRIVFDTAGIYPVKLVVSTDKGCKDSITHVIKLGHPHAHYLVNVDYGGDVYANPLVTLTDHSYDHQLAINNWQWNFGNSTSSTLQNPSAFHYSCGGNYNVALHITDEIPCTSDTTSVVVIKIRPHALYSISSPNYTPDAYARPIFTFTDNTTVNDGCPNLRYNWRFGDGYTSTSQNPTHAFKGSGVYSVRLIVTNLNGGLKDTVTQSVTVAIKPKALFSTSQLFIPNIYASPTITYNNTTSSTDTAAPPASLQYAWDFGDGSTSNSMSPTHVYAAGGSYTVTLTVTNPISGLSDVTSNTVVIVIKPKSDFTVSAAVFSPDVYAQPSYTFTNTSNVNDASGSLTYAWNFGDGGTSTSISPSHTYTASGTYTVTLVVTNSNGGAADTKTTTVIVAIKPKASFTTSVTNNTGGYPVVSVTNNSSVNETATLTYTWAFGDGGTSASASPSAYTYNTSAASRTIRLIATNPNSSLKDTSDVVLNNMYILPSNLTYNVPTTDLTVNYTATATDNSGGTLSYSWSFSDGGTASTASGAYTFANAGTYTATLAITSSNGGSVSISPITFTVTNPVPVARILASLASSTTGSTDWSLQDGSTISSGSIVNSKLDYYYTSGGGVGSTTTIDPFTGVYNFTIPDFYTLTATLTVTSDRGVQNSVTAFIDPTNNVYSGFKKGTPSSSGTPSATKVITPFVGSATLFPNPATNVVTVKYKTMFAGAVVIRVFDMSGRQVLQQSVATIGANQTNTTSINVSNLVKGTYNVVLSMNGAKLFGSQLIKAQ